MECKICESHALFVLVKMTRRWRGGEVRRCCTNAKGDAPFTGSISTRDKEQQKVGDRAAELFGPVVSNLIRSCQVPAEAKSAFWQQQAQNLRNIQKYLQLFYCLENKSQDCG